MNEAAYEAAAKADYESTRGRTERWADASPGLRAKYLRRNRIAVDAFLAEIDAWVREELPPEPWAHEDNPEWILIEGDPMYLLVPLKGDTYTTKELLGMPEKPKGDT